ncbi:MAG: NAD-dependent deacylase [Acidobacteriota bacterium]|nr:NAD-dependent deacylase [Acidobacteriota bacterium]MDQ5871879.1 NAD-dependent deacylase [Acidobacteriota bacterium]
MTVATGAGVSAASGVPTFRGADGLWNDFRVEELATPEAFARDPRLVWEWYEWRRHLIAGCAPNRAHEVLAAWSHRYPRFTLVTQNVDGLHERAGTQNVVRFHGSIWELACWSGCSSAERWRDESALSELPPPCPRCGGLARPGVVWFGEPIEPLVLEASLAALDCDVFLVAGTSAVVYPAAGLADEARRRGAFTIEINPERTEARSRFDLALQGRAEDLLDRLEGDLSSGRRLSSSQ